MSPSSSLVGVIGDANDDEDVEEEVSEGVEGIDVELPEVSMVKRGRDARE